MMYNGTNENGGVYIMFDTKKAMLYTTVAISVMTVAAVGMLLIKEKNERQKLGGKLIRVNYKFSKEFDD